jgi:hypothetical protein
MLHPVFVIYQENLHLCSNPGLRIRIRLDRIRIPASANLTQILMDPEIGTYYSYFYLFKRTVDSILFVSSCE